jgi:D-beta-D-heptose 7-phosphate kinase/D-beta-D-heptose 1-phosphate adenosyltransferase
VPARRFHHASVAGAGDTFSAAAALALSAGGSPESAVDLASAAAGVVVEKQGTACCTVSELRQSLSGEGKYVADAKLLASWCDATRKDGRRIVFTNGCFDILHAGHISYLNQARAEGDLLIVGLNSDDSVRRLKGPNRPINPLGDRARVLAALACVDYVVPFAQDTPASLIRALRPDVFVKGGDYTEETLPEAPLVHELGGRIAIMPFVDDRSTSRVIARIREAEALERRRGHRNVTV